MVSSIEVNKKGFIIHDGEKTWFHPSCVCVSEEDEPDNKGMVTKLKKRVFIRGWRGGLQTGALQPCQKIKPMVTGWRDEEG